MKTDNDDCKVAALESVTKHSDLIYDVGLHKGEDSDFYLRKGFRVIAFEADPDLTQLCRERFKEFIASGRLIIVEGAILDPKELTKKTVSFFKNSKNSVWGTIDNNWSERNERLGCPSTLIEIATVDFSAVLRKHGIPYYMKVDIEGSDMVCINALKRFRERPNFVSLESDTTSFRNLKNEIETLSALGYHTFRAIEQSTIPSQTLPNPPKEGKYITQHFEEGSSGLFGMELGGEWSSKPGILRQYRKIWVVLYIIGKMNRWKFRGARRLKAMTGKFLTLLTGKSAWGWYDTHARHCSASETSDRPQSKQNET